MALTQAQVQQLKVEEQEQKELRNDIRFIKKNVLDHAKIDCRYAKSNYCY